MKQEEMDVAREPVDLNDDADFMDTGVLHDQRVCTRCSKQPTAKGHSECAQCLEGAK